MKTLPFAIFIIIISLFYFAEANTPQLAAGMKPQETNSPPRGGYRRASSAEVHLDANAQMMSGFSNTTRDWDEVVEHTLREEKEGKELWEKLQSKEVTCADFGDEQFGILGEYFMGQMMRDSHPSMNAMMIQMHGEEGEEQIHIVIGKRLSGCDTSAAFAPEWGGWMPMMMNMGWSLGEGGWSPMMWNMGYGFGWFGGLFMLLWWALIVIGIIALVRWLLIQSHGSSDHEKSPLEILKERYARGEIDKKEFEEKKKELS